MSILSRLFGRGFREEYPHIAAVARGLTTLALVFVLGVALGVGLIWLGMDRFTVGHDVGVFDVLFILWRHPSLALWFTDDTALIKSKRGVEA